MNYNRIGIVGTLVLISSLQLGAMEGSLPDQKKTLQLISVSPERIAAHKKRWQEWEKSREPYQNIAANTGILMGLGCVGYLGYRWLRANTGQVASQAEADNLNIRVLLLENPPAAAPPDNSWTGWGIGKLWGGCSLVAYYGAHTLRSFIIGKGVSMLSKVLPTTSLEKKVTRTVDYAFRSRTLLWLLQEDCALGPVLETLKTLQDSVFDILRGDATYSQRLIMGVNGLVREIEKVVGHLAFVQEQLPEKDSYDYEREIAESSTNLIIAQLTTILKATRNFLLKIDHTFSTMEEFTEVVGGFYDTMWASLEAIFGQMKLFQIVERSLNSETTSNEADSLKAELRRLRSLIRPVEYNEEGRAIDPTDLLIEQTKEYLVQEGIRQGFEKVVPSVD